MAPVLILMNLKKEKEEEEKTLLLPDHNCQNLGVQKKIQSTVKTSAPPSVILVEVNIRLRIFSSNMKALGLIILFCS